MRKWTFEKALAEGEKFREVCFAESKAGKIADLTPTVRDVKPFPGKRGYRIAYKADGFRYWGRPTPAIEKEIYGRLLGMHKRVNNRLEFVQDMNGVLVLIDRKGVVAYYCNSALKGARCYYNAAAVFHLGNPHPRERTYYTWFAGMFQLRTTDRWQPPPQPLVAADVATMTAAPLTAQLGAETAQNVWRAQTRGNWGVAQPAPLPLRRRR